MKKKATQKEYDSFKRMAEATKELTPTTTKESQIKIVGRIKKNKNLYFCNYSPLLDNAINNFKEAKTVRIFKGVCYINFMSLGYFTEILSRDKVSYSVITTLN